MNNSPRPGEKGFTLVELVVILAIGGILAASTIPNFIKADVRAKLAQARADMKEIDLAIHAFELDQGIAPVACSVLNINAEGYPTTKPPYSPLGVPPGTCGLLVSDRLIQLTTPAQYLTHNYVNGDPFAPESPGYDSYDYWSVSTWKYAFNGNHPNSYAPNYSRTVRGALWRLVSAGPDRIQTFGGPAWVTGNPANPGLDYDPTNGIISNGDVVQVGPKSDDPGNCMYPDQVFPCW